MSIARVPYVQVKLFFNCILGTPAALTEEDLPADLFPVLFQCQDHPQPSWRALLAYSIGLQRPLLALLASYYEVREGGRKGL